MVYPNQAIKNNHVMSTLQRHLVLPLGTSEKQGRVEALISPRISHVMEGYKSTVVCFKIADIPNMRPNLWL